MSNLQESAQAPSRNSKTQVNWTGRRKRSAIACARCRQRKVRCDVPLSGIPCTNCRLDWQACTIPPKCRRQGVNRSPGEVDGALQVLNSVVLRKDTKTQDPRKEGAPAGMPSKKPVGNTTAAEDEGVVHHSQQVSSGIPCCQIMQSCIPRVSQMLMYPHSYLESIDFRRHPKEDIWLLQTKGCFLIPLNVDRFIEQYFLHVHPCLPVLDEAEFWDIYHQRGPWPDKKRKTIPLVVFQALLFASCTHVSAEDIQLAGFPKMYEGHSTLYNRAKLLLDVGFETNPLYKAQASILMTFQSSSIDLNAPVVWLTHAIENAQECGAHVYHHIMTDKAQRLVKKRLWWSIIIRDRVLSLGLRRYPKIIPSSFDVEWDLLEEEDVRGEIGHSKVYDARTKTDLLTVQSILCRLCLAMTAPLATAYSPTPLSAEEWTRKCNPKEYCSRLSIIQSQLNRWSMDAAAAITQLCERGDVHHSVALFFNIMTLYYHTALIALYNSQVYQVTQKQNHSPTQLSHQLKPLGYELQKGISGVANVMKNLIVCGTAQHLPISLTAHFAFPMVLHEIDLELLKSSRNADNCNQTRTVDLYATMVRTCEARYHGTDVITHVIKNLVQIVRSPGFLEIKERMCAQAITHEVFGAAAGTIYPQFKPKLSLRTWWDAFLQSPETYLGVLQYLDIALSLGERFLDNTFFTDAVRMESQEPSASEQVCSQAQMPTYDALGHMELVPNEQVSTLFPHEALIRPVDEDLDASLTNPFVTNNMTDTLNVSPTAKSELDRTDGIQIEHTFEWLFNEVVSQL